MQNLKGKTLAIVIAAILTLSMAASMTLLPNAGAHTPPWQIQLFAFVNVAPNPLGSRPNCNHRLLAKFTANDSRWPLR